jgi:class 3 adenylate cyclase
MSASSKRVFIPLILGLFVVFNDVSAAAMFALNLRDMVVKTNWTELGLPVDLDIRIGMHSGPVFMANDPVLDKDNFFGSQVNRAARVEPVAVPGSVIVTEQSACLLVSHASCEYACEYLGSMELAKKYGSGRLYRLRRWHELD